MTRLRETDGEREREKAIRWAWQEGRESSLATLGQLFSWGDFNRVKDNLKIM